MSNLISALKERPDRKQSATATRDANSNVQMFPVQTLHGDRFRKDAQLREQMNELVSHRYIDPSTLLNREFERCDTLYLARSTAGELLSFQLVAWETIEVGGQLYPTARIGLLATSGGTMEEFSVVQLYRRLFEDAKDREAQLGREIVVWATTANPGAFLGFQFLFRDVQPAIDGSYNAQAEAIARSLRRSYDVEQECENPFYLPKVFHFTSYSPQETARLTVLARKKKFRLFEQWNVDEFRGDRVLLIGYVPRDNAPITSEIRGGEPAEQPVVTSVR